MSHNNAFEVSITAIIHKDGKYLITKRSPTKKRFPNLWTVPGGHLGVDDFKNYPKDTEECWYSILERALEREVMEEVHLSIENVRYLTSLIVDIKDEKTETVPLVISCLADYKEGKVVLDENEATEYAWVTTEESKSYPLIGGILEEFIMADKLRETGRIQKWTKS